MGTMVELKLNVSEKGQVLIPKVLREKYGIEEGGFIIIEPTDEGILLKRRPNIEETLEALEKHAARLRDMGVKGPKLGELKEIFLEIEFEEKQP